MVYWPRSRKSEWLYFNYGSDDESLVEDLLDEGYIVVSLLYRLAKYGANSTEISSNTLTWDDQLDDIDSAITHISNNFPTCLDEDADEIHIIGESAGAHLSLLYAYERADSTIVKSVVSMYAPTNLNQYGNYLNTPASGWPFACGGIFVPINYPRQLPPFPIDLPSGVLSYNTHSGSCGIASWLEDDLEDSYGEGDLTFRVFKTYNAILSSVAEMISTPLSSSTLEEYSPWYSLENGINQIPTFIMHGDDDGLVPYDDATDDMEDALDDFGDIIKDGSNNIHDGTNVSIPASSAYSTYSEKHLIKLYTNTDHNFNATDATRDTIRNDVVIWINGH